MRPSDLLSRLRSVSRRVAAWARALPAELRSRRAALPTPAARPATPPVPSVASASALPTLGAGARAGLGGATLVLVGALLLGFAAQFMLLSQVSQARDQDLAFDALRVELADSKAPVGQVGPDDRLLPLGTPVAILEIESLGLRQVVLEGTTSAILMSGPGHRRDTPLPGQAGASVIYGRQSAYGAPFARIASLRTGAEISVTTGQGESRYRVTDVRRSGDQISGTIGDAAGRLTLVTASGIPFLPDGIVRVDAELVGSAKTTPSRVLSYPALGEEELAMTGDDSALPRLVLALLALVVLAPLASIGIRTWGRWQVWIVAVPTFAALGIWAARELAILLPNLT